MNVYSFDNFYHMEFIKGSEGGEGKAYKVEAPDFDSIVCLKVYHAHTVGKTRNNEVDKLLNVSHENIIRILGLFHDAEHGEEKFGVLMEYMAGGSLSSVIHSRKEYSHQDVFNWILQASIGLQYLHDEQIVHRDIKPENMLLDDAHKLLKLSDFGLARSLEQITTSNSGTRRYMAPELLTANRETLRDVVRFPIDVYAFGITIWEMFHRERPFEQYGAFAINERVAEKRERPKVEGYLDSEIREMIWRTWKHNPEDRCTVSDIMNSAKMHLSKMSSDQTSLIATVVAPSRTQDPSNRLSATSDYGLCAYFEQLRLARQTREEKHPLNGLVPGNLSRTDSTIVEIGPPLEDPTATLLDGGRSLGAEETKKSTHDENGNREVLSNTAVMNKVSTQCGSSAAVVEVTCDGFSFELVQLWRLHLLQLSEKEFNESIQEIRSFLRRAAEPSPNAKVWDITGFFEDATDLTVFFDVCRRTTYPGINFEFYSCFNSLLIWYDYSQTPMSKENELLKMELSTETQLKLERLEEVYKEAGPRLRKYPSEKKFNCLLIGTSQLNTVKLLDDLKKASYDYKNPLELYKANYTPFNILKGAKMCESAERIRKFIEHYIKLAHSIVIFMEASDEVHHFGVEWDQLLSHCIFVLAGQRDEDIVPGRFKCHFRGVQPRHYAHITYDPTNISTDTQTQIKGKTDLYDVFFKSYELAAQNVIDNIPALQFYSPPAVHDATDPRRISTLKKRNQRQKENKCSLM